MNIEDIKMKVDKVNSNSFCGQIVEVGKISKTQKYLFNLHRQSILKMLQDMPFDLYVKQSSSKKNIMLSTDKDFSKVKLVKKNTHAFENPVRDLVNEKCEILKKERERDFNLMYGYILQKLNPSILC